MVAEQRRDGRLLTLLVLLLLLLLVRVLELVLLVLVLVLDGGREGRTRGLRLLLLLDRMVLVRKRVDGREMRKREMSLLRTVMVGEEVG